MKKVLILILLFCISINYAYCKTNKTDNKSNYINISFWKKFNDDILIDNLLKVYHYNNDLKAATIKTNEAQRIVKMSFADELPNIGFKGYAGQIFHSSNEIFGEVEIPDYTESHFLLPLTMNYEIDIWGKNHLKTHSKNKQLEMVKQNERAAYIYIFSAFASDYYNLIRADKLIEYQSELIETQKELISSLKKKCDLGTATINDVDKAEKQLMYFEEELENLLKKQDILKNQMNVILSDRSFDDISRADFAAIKKDFTIPDRINASMIDNRPDKIKSELNLQKAGIDIQTAKRDLLPKFIINGNIGFNMYNISSPHKFLADVGLVPVWDIFTGGKKLQLLKLKKDSYDIAIQNYEKTILKSIQEINDSLYGLKSAVKINNFSNKRLTTDEKLLSDLIIKEEAGIVDNIDLLVHKESLIVSKKLSVNTEINKLIGIINLYQALGGSDFENIESL